MWVGMRRWPRLKPVSEVAEAKLETARSEVSSYSTSRRAQGSPLSFIGRGEVEFILDGERWPTKDGASEGRILGEGLSECVVEAPGLRLTEVARKARGEKASFDRCF